MADSRPGTPAHRPGTPSDGAPPPPSKTSGEKNGAKPLGPHQLDIPKLHSLPSEQQNLLLLTFTADLAKHVDSLDGDGATAEQVELKKEVFQIINLAQPAPTRVIRNNLGRCLYGILSKGSRKILYESINELVAIVNAAPKEVDFRAKHAAVSCLGSVFEAAGDSATSLSPLAATALLKLFKGASNETGLRAAIFKALGRVARGIRTAVDEDIARSVWKQARKAAEGDKSLLVQTQACACLEQLIRTTPYLDNSNDFEKLQAVILKALDSSCVAVRHAAASCFAAGLVKSFSESPGKDAVPRIRKPRKTKKNAKPEDLEEEMERASSPAPEKPATALSYTLPEILKILGPLYCRPSTSNKARAGIAVTYIKLLKQLGESVVEERYGDIAKHLFNDILSYPGFSFGNKYRLMISRKFVRVILEKVVGKMLGETAQMNACRWLLNEVIKDYPQAIKERPEPGKQVLIGAVSALSSLMKDLDAAIGPQAESFREGLLQCLQHPSYAVQIHTARALRTFVLAMPQQLLPTVTICMNSVQRELSQLGTHRQSPRRCTGYAHGLAAVLSTSPRHPLYGSVDVYARVLQQATALLKSSGSSDIRVSGCQLQVAWVMIGGLMSLGPNFVKIHLPQLMLLWKNALPKPVGRENMAQRNMLELSYLAHVRECALGSIKAFLAFNQRLLTSDISKRLAVMLESTVAFVQLLPEKRVSDDPGNRLSPSLQLHDYEVMVRRRVFQCFSQLLTLSPTASLEATAHSTVLPLAVASFSDAQFYAPSSLGAAIATAAASFEDIWNVGDNYGFGVTGLVSGLDIRDPVDPQRMERHWSSRQEVEDAIDQTIASPVCSSAENDGTFCYLDLQTNTTNEDGLLPNSSATETVDAAMCAFGLCLPLQAPRLQESTLEQLSANMTSLALQKDPARKAAITANAAVALLTACKVAVGESGAAKGDLRHQTTEKLIQSLLHTCLKDPDESVRHMAAAAIGRLCSSSGNASTVTEVTYLTETIVNNREPHVRAGCALALASIHSQLGGMAAGFHMKNIVGILMSLAADTHPLVHIWALDALAQVADSAGLGFSGYVTSCLGMLGRVYVGEGHNVECASLASSNMGMMLPANVGAAVARGVDAVTNVLGPDLQDMTKSRDMIVSLVGLFSEEGEEEVGVRLESLRCWEHLSLYAPGYVEFERYVRRLQRDVDDTRQEVRESALHGLFTLMRRDATDIVRTALPGLEERLWDYLNDEPGQKHIRAAFTNWLQQTGPSDPAGWIQRCNNILTKTKAKTVPAEQPKTAGAKDTAGPTDLQDEEVAGFAAAAGVNKDEEATAPSSTQELMRWQVRLFALECLHSLIATIAKEAAVSVDTSPGEAALQRSVADVIRIAFSASTAGVTALRVVGLRIVDQILQQFGRTPDPDFPEAMLLEQYQAQISSALTPAFAADSSPELAAEAVNVCATFISTGIVTDVERMGRILKLLVGALESFSRDAETATIGELRSLSANAQVMVRMAVFSAWAELQIASAEQKYLVQVVKPHMRRLVPLWLTSLREYAKLRFEPDISASMGSVGSGGAAAGADLDMVYAAFNRQTLLSFYAESWLSLVDAIASLIEEDSEFVFDALDGKGQEEEVKPSENGEKEAHEDEEPPNGVASGIIRKSTGINYRSEPVAFFFVLFGLAFESLAVRTNDDDAVVKQRNLDILRALKKILRPSVSGNAVYQEVVFNETMDLLDRMVLTESLGVQGVIVEIARNLCMSHPSSRQGNDAEGEALSDDIEQLFELTRIIVLVLAGLIPGLAETPVSSRLEGSDEAVGLVRTALQALVDVSEVFPSIIKTDLRATILHIFVTILGTGVCQPAVVPQALAIFRRFVNSITDDGRPETREQLRNALARMLIILSHAQRRETDASLPCEKNTLLTITILISAASTELPHTDPLVARFIAELTESLDAPSTSRVAAGCIRTLLASAIAPSTLLTAGITFLLTPSDLDGIDESKTLMSQTLTMFAARTRAPAATALAMRTLVARAVQAGTKVYAESAARLLELAQADAVGFRGVVQGLGGEDKGVVEAVLKSAGAGRQRGEVEGRGEPTIALKMDF